MAFETFREVVRLTGNRVKSFLTPEKSEKEVKIKEDTAVVSALQTYENAVNSFVAAPDDKHTAVENALKRFEEKHKEDNKNGQS